MKLLALTIVCLAGAIACAPCALAYDSEHIAIHADGASWWGAYSADGRYVTLATYATNLAEGDTNGFEDVVIYDRETHHFSLISVASDGSQGNGDSWGGAMTQDGRYVVFHSSASNLVAGDTNGVWDTFVRDRLTGQTFRVSISTVGIQGNGHSGGGQISADGRYVVFGSNATNLVPGDTNGVGDVFLRDLVTHQTTRISLATDGSQARAQVYGTRISADGRYVVFQADGDPGLVPGVTGSTQLYLRDLALGETTLIAEGSVGYMGCAGISGDGRFVAYYSSGSACIWDRLTGTSVHIVPILHGQVADSMSADGRIVGLHTTDSTSILDWMNWTYDTVHEQARPWGIAGGFMLVSPSGSALAYTSLRGPSSDDINEFYLTNTDGIVCSFGSIAGTVTAGGAPVAEAEVWIDGCLWTKTGADGTYCFPSLHTDAVYAMVADAAGQFAYADSVPVTAGGVTTVDFALGPVGTIAGTVRDDITGAPISAATVVCGRFSATTRPDGSYQLRNVPVGTGLTVTATHPLYHEGSVADVTVATGQTTLDLLLRTRLGSVSGTVRDADSQAGLSDASVTCGEVSTITGPDGTYALPGVLEGTGLTVTADHPTHRPVAIPGLSVVGGYATPVDFVLPLRIGAVKGQVADSVTGLPIPGATIALGDLTQESDQQGAYLFPKVVIGTYPVTASAAGYPADSFSVTVEEGKTTFLRLPLAAASTGTIVGTVIDATSHAPLSGALVSCGGAHTYTVGGEFTLPDIAVGDGYEVGAAAAGYQWALQRNVSVAAGQTTEVALALSPYPGTGFFEDVSDALPLPATLGAAWGDYDDDGYPDLLLPGYFGLIVGRRGPLLFRNNHDLTLTDVTTSVGLPADPADQRGAAWADYDNDGDLDVLITTRWDDGGRLVLYRNDGGTFVDASEEAGLADIFCSGSTAAWCDYDGDNWLDFFVGHSHLLHSNRDGTFAEVSEPCRSTLLQAFDQAAWGDTNGDGFAELVVVATSSGSIFILTDHGDGTFSWPRGPAGGTTGVSAIALGDYDNDGWLDIYASSGGWTPDWLLHNNGDGTFTDMAAGAGLGSDTDAGAGVAWADYDNDGWLDAYVVNSNGMNVAYLWHNDGNGTFHDTLAEAGLDAPRMTRITCSADIDVDGRPDLISASWDAAGTHLLHNVTPGRNWLRVRALTSETGDATAVDIPARDALGARVEVNVDNNTNFLPGRTLIRLIDGGAGFNTQNEPVAQFGIPTDGPVAVRVIFPNGSVVVQKDTAIDQQTVIRSTPVERLFLFVDVQSDFWAAGQIEACVQAGIVQGYPDGSYGPAILVTRDQMAVYVARALAGGDAQVPTGPEVPSFSDVGTDHWAYKYIEYAASPGADVVQGYPGGNYKPDDLVNRGQMAVYIARAMVSPTGDAGVPDPPAGGPTFPDVTATGDWSWCYKHVEYLAAEGIVQGYPDGTYHPATIVTRDQMAVYIARAFDLPL